MAINNLNISNQPLKYKSLYLSFNGEIYNYRELNKKFNLNVKSEIEVVAKFFSEDGVEFLLAQAKKGKFKHHIWGVYLFSKWIKMNDRIIN